MSLARNLSDNANNILNLEFHLLIEMDPVKQTQLQELMGRMVNQKKELEAKAETSSHEFLSIVSSPISQLQQTPDTPATPSGLTKPTVNLRRSSATITDNSESDSMKKRHIEDTTMVEENEVSQIVEVEQMVTDIAPHEPVRLINHLTMNMLIVTYDDIPVSVMTYSSYKRWKATICGWTTQTTHNLMIGPAGVHGKDTQLKEI